MSAFTGVVTKRDDIDTCPKVFSLKNGIYYKPNGGKRRLHKAAIDISCFVGVGESTENQCAFLITLFEKILTLIPGQMKSFYRQNTHIF